MHYEHDSLVGFTGMLKVTGWQYILATISSSASIVIISIGHSYSVYKDNTYVSRCNEKDLP